MLRQRFYERVTETETTISILTPNALSAMLLRLRVYDNIKSHSIH